MVSREGPAASSSAVGRLTDGLALFSGVAMSTDNYRRIDPQVWSDGTFQQIWSNRWRSPSRCPKRLGYPLVPGRYDDRELLCLSRRNRFRKIRDAILSDLCSKHGSHCMSCGRSDATLVPDHIIPICWGGTNDRVNFQLLCVECNSRKHGLLPLPPVDEVQHV